MKICNIFGKGARFSRGKVHRYLGIDIYWSQDGPIIVSMIKYLQKIIDDLPEVIHSTYATYAAEYLFTVQCKKERKILSEDQAQHFHQTVVQLVFVCMRDRLDIQPLVVFLAMRVRSPDEDSWGGLKRGLKYLKFTLYMKLYLRADYINMTIWWVYASYSTHWDHKSNTGAVM